MDSNKLIGRSGGLPWRIPEDFKSFKAITLDKAIIMGRRTFTEDIKRVLPRRLNIVVTRDPAWQHPGVEVAHSLEQAYQIAAERLPEALECYVIGGAQLCREAMAVTDRVYLTVVHEEFEGDTWFDSFDFDDWRIIEERRIEVGENNRWPFTFYTLDRV